VSRYYSYFNTAVNFVRSYTYAEPFASFLKKQFAADKKFGSRDRKTIAHLCYCYFRMGHLMNNESVQERMITSLFLCSVSKSELLKLAKPDWDEKAELPVADKLKELNLSATDLFPYTDELSDGIDVEAFCNSHFTQPDLFLRIRPEMKETVLRKLNTAAIAYELIGDDCVALSNTTKIDEVLQLNKEVVVQDYSSQRVGDLLINLKSEIVNRKLKIWDCCAASGGKSIMAKDILGDIDLTVSDIRESILLNLKKRFADAGITNYKSFVSDLTANDYRHTPSDFQLIIADVPCSGSGTWGRTPEYLSFFKKEQIDEYSALQKKIASNVIAHLQPNGYLLYITCSVYKNENEEVVKFLQGVHNLELIEMKLLKGYEQKADTMFAALLKRPD
jgi:16S rRNA (cytosine967-C5)-methyltransferase